MAFFFIFKIMEKKSKKGVYNIVVCGYNYQSKQKILI